MSNINPSEQTDVLTCKVTLPIKCTPLELGEVLQMDVITQANINRLNIILNLNETHPHDLDEESPGLAREFQRIDLKINVILEMVGQLILQGGTLPEPVSINLNPHYIEWHESASSLELDQRVKLELFPDMRVPFPLVFCGKIESISAADNKQDNIKIRLDPLDEPFLELLEKYIFRCHRRDVARMRQDKSVESG